MMIPDKSAFISYQTVSGRRVRMGNNLFAPILGTGSAIISLNGKRILIQDCLHIPALRNPLYSLRAHQRQHGCGFIGMHDLGMYIFFPSFIVEVNTTTDCHLLYEPIGQSTTMSNLDYVQLVQHSNSASSVAATPSLPAVIKEYNDNNYLPTYAPHWPKKPPTPPLPAYNMSLIPSPAYSVSLKDLDRDALIQRLYSVKLPAPPRPLHQLVKRPKRDPLRQSWNACPQMILLPTPIIQSLVSRLFGHVILQTCQIQKPPILPRNCIASLAVIVFATTNILF